MFDLYFAKFTQHADLKKLLLSTGKRPLVRHARDVYWGGKQSIIGEIISYKNQINSMVQGTTIKEKYFQRSEKRSGKWKKKICLFNKL